MAVVISDLYAWVLIDPLDRGGVAAVDGGKGKMLPLVSTKREIMVLAKEAAQDVSRQIGLPIRLMHFKAVGDIDEVFPISGKA